MDHVFHFYHPERTILKKLIAIDSNSHLFLHGTNDFAEEWSGKISVCSSDPEVTSEIRFTVSKTAVFFKISKIEYVVLILYLVTSSESDWSKSVDYIILHF